MKLSDLVPGTMFDEPAVPAARGTDAELFKAYACYQETRAEVMELEERVMCDASLERRRRKATGAHDRARQRIMRLPALTLEGVILKLELALAGQMVPVQEVVPDELGFLYSAIADLKSRISAEAPAPEKAQAA